MTKKDFILTIDNVFTNLWTTPYPGSEVRTHALRALTPSISSIVDHGSWSSIKIIDCWSLAQIVENDDRRSLAIIKDHDRKLKIVDRGSLLSQKIVDRSCHQRSLTDFSQKNQEDFELTLYQKKVCKFRFVVKMCSPRLTDIGHLLDEKRWFLSELFWRPQTI